MERYQGFYLEGEKGNNCFTYGERGESSRLRVPKLVSGGLQDIKIGLHPVFSEKNEEGIIEYFFGLQNFVKMQDFDVPVYVFDNHNHALYFWILEAEKTSKMGGVPLIHIDQHSDLKANPFQLKRESLDDVFVFVNEQCNVGNFIQPALQTGFIGVMEQIRTEWALLNYQNQYQHYILDIDLDFWAEEMGIEQFDDTIQKVKSLIPGAMVVTIATSPYFLAQERAIELLHLLLAKED